MKSIFYLHLTFIIAHFLSFNPSLEAQDDNRTFKVVLDAGHGGHDPGNLGNGFMEKNIALGIVLQAGEHLKKNPDIEVIYTREDDSFVDLYVRGEIANKANADLFVSVHCDSHSSDAYGAHTFVLGLHANDQNFEIAKKENSVIYLEDDYESRYAEYDINSPESVIGLTIMQEEFLDQSIELAKLVQNNFSKKLNRRDRKVKQAGFIVLHQTFMPSILIETGFLTNKEEGKYLNSKKGQLQMGKAIADAIVNYKENVRADASISFLPDDTIDGDTNDNTVVMDKGSSEEPVPDKIDNKPVTKTPEKQEPAVDSEVPEDFAEEMKSPREIQKPQNPGSQVLKTPNSGDHNSSGGSDTVVGTTTGAGTSVGTGKPANKPRIIFKVQIMASVKELALEPGNFNGLNRITKEPYKNLYRYMYGTTESYEQAKLLKSGANASGYTSSYIVAYENGVRIPVKEALAKL